MFIYITYLYADSVIHLMKTLAWLAYIKNNKETYIFLKNVFSENSKSLYYFDIIKAEPDIRLQR